MRKYRKRPVVIEAVQWDGDLDTVGRILKWLGASGSYSPTLNRFEINTLEGTMVANLGSYIIKGVEGEFYPCRADIFEQTYESC